MDKMKKMGELFNFLSKKTPANKNPTKGIAIKNPSCSAKKMA